MKISTHPSSRGFSLIEVIVAMGIVATVMVGLIGILPSGVASLHEASTVAIQSRIVQEMISNAQQSEWDTKTPIANEIPKPKLSELLGTSNIRRYDAQGNLITGAGFPGQVAAYASLMELETATGSHPVILTYTKGYSHLRKIYIYVEYTPGGRAPMPKDPNRAKFVKKYTLLLANMGTSESLK
jgi:uncharacterized protein (TIGR02598 family)